MTSIAVNPDSRAAFDPRVIRAEFPALQQSVHGEPLVYLDNAATTQRPLAVLAAIDHFYRHDNANVHRGVHELSVRATAAYEEARGRVQRFINAARPSECIFTAGTTDAINLVAGSWAPANLGPGDRILVTHMEHHSNIVPWQLACERTGATLDVAPVTDAGEIDLDGFRAKLTERTKLVAFVAVSNALGTINPARDMIAAAHDAGAVVLVDAAQALPHVRVDVQALGCDFLAGAAHKVFGPTGIGVLYGKQTLLDAMPPYRGGGEMIEQVTFEKSTYAPLPAKFEAGTPNIAGAIGFGAALEYVRSLDWTAVEAHEEALLHAATERLAAIDGLRIIGTAATKVPVVSFVLDWAHPYDIGPVLDRAGVAVRTGHHCTQPLMERFGVAATIRASFSFYNTLDEVDRLVSAIEKARRFFT